jgi:DNA-binding CsgD family transcriptional regulator
MPVIHAQLFLILRGGERKPRPHQPMTSYRHRRAQPKGFSALIRALPEDERGSPEATGSAWRAWHREGALNIGVVEAHDSKPARIAAIGVTLWISDEAVEHLAAEGAESVSRRLYAAAAAGHDWVLGREAILQAHRRDALNLLILHYWSSCAPGEPGFNELFVHSHANFRELHYGFGVGRLLQEVPAEAVPLMQASGTRVLRAATATAARALMGIDRAEALRNPGSTLAFLFLHPAAQLDLRPAQQCVLQLALSDCTDDEISRQLGCSRAYVRKLWGEIYAALESRSVLAIPSPRSPAQRGPERRRSALEFFRSHPEELRPGIPSRLARA